MPECSKAVEKSPLERELMVVDRKTNEILDKLRILSDRMSPILAAPAAPEKQCAAEGLLPGSSPAVEMIRGISRGPLETAITLLDDLNQRLEV